VLEFISQQHIISAKMPPRRPPRRGVLSNLERDIYQVVRRLEDLDDGPLTVGAVYELIKNSNSSLARLKRKPLEDAIENVLDTRKTETGADEEDEDSDAALEEAMKAEELSKAEQQAARDASLLNRQMTKHWNVSRKSKKLPEDEAMSEKMEVEAASSNRLSNGEPNLKRRRNSAKKEVDRSPAIDISTEDLAGMEDVLDQLDDLIGEPLCESEEWAQVSGNRAPVPVLIHGPSGCGKTTLINAIAADIGVAYIPISCPTIVGGVSGESEKNIQQHFDEAIQLAPSILFLDNIETIAGKLDGSSKPMDGRILTVLGNGLDRVRSSVGRGAGKYVVVVAATNSPDSLDPYFRRRFGREVNIGMPNDLAREIILRKLTRNIPVDDEVDFKALAKMTSGYVGSDLDAVVASAVTAPLRERRPARLGAGRNRYERLRTGKPLQPVHHRIKLAHFESAISMVQPAARREGFSTIPDTTWSDVGALSAIRSKLESSIIGPIRNPELYSDYGIRPAAGILLYGPPGCGKTLVAKAVANESRANFISIKGPELLNKWVGESERAVRALFTRARASAPCVLFFDELDALVPRRDDSQADSTARVVNAMLTELDGVGDRSGIYVVGATNRADLIDAAMRRPGRFDTSLYVGLPTAEERVDILATLFRRQLPSASLNLDAARRVALDPRCVGFSGADLGSLLQAAGHSGLRRAMAAAGSGRAVIDDEDWEAALRETKPSVKDLHKYEAPED
jgi:ribosome biogenesis ATPase